MAYERKTAAIDLIDWKSLVRCLSPELMLVDPELAERARELLRDPGETNGKGNMSALGMHEISSSAGLGLEPPLSPPVVGGPRASAAFDSSPAFGPSDLPSPPPALRPPESAPVIEPEVQPVQASAPEEIPASPAPEVSAPAPAPAPAPIQAPVQQPEPVEPAPLMAPPPVEAPAPVAPEPVSEPVPEPVQQPAPELVPVQAEPEPEPEPELPAMAPEAPAEPELPAMAPVPDLAPVQPAAQAEDYFVTPATPPTPAPAPEPVEPAQPEIQPVTLTPPAAPPVEAPAAPEAHVAPDELPVIEFPPAALEPTIVDEPVFVPEQMPAEMPSLESELFNPFGQAQSVFRVVVRLQDGDGVEVGEFRDFGTAMEGAQEVIEQFANANGSWPFYAGRFIRPDLIVSVDVVDGSSA